MRLLTTAHPGTSHLRVVAPIAQAAQKAGHTVAVASNVSMREEVEAYGLTFLEAGLDWRTNPGCRRALGPAWMSGDNDAYLDALVHRCALGRPALRMAQDLLGLAEEWRPDAIVREGEEVGATLAADVLGIPCAAVLSGTTYRITPEVAREPLDRLRSELGQGPTSNPFTPYRDLNVSWVPARYWQDPPAPSLLRCYTQETPTRSDDVFPDWVHDLSGTRPFVLASVGTCLDGTPEQADRMLGSVIAGLGQVDCDAAVSIGVGRDPAELPEPPRNVRLINTWIAQSAVLELADVYVNHAGYGSIRESLRAGVPMVLLPIKDDEPYHARCADGLGVARVLAENAPTEAVTEAVNEVLGDAGYRRRAAGVKREMLVAPGPDQVVTDIEALTARTQAA